MGCKKTLSIVEQVSGFMPLDAAIYVASVDKIFGVCGNYLVQFNAETGLYERMSKVCGCMGPMSLTQLNDVIYVAAWNDPAATQRFYGESEYPHRGIYPVNPSSMEVSPRLGLMDLFYGTYLNWTNGPHSIMACNGYLWWFWTEPDNSGMMTGPYWANPLNLADRCTNLSFSGGQDWLYGSQMTNDGSSIYHVDPYGYAWIWNPPYSNSDDDYWSYDRGATYSWFSYMQAPGCEWVGGATSKLFIYGRPGILWTIDSWAVGGFTRRTLVMTDLAPVHARWNSVDGQLYLPDQSKDGVMIYDPVSMNEVWKSGFESPHDVVFTPTKKWAVQSSAIGLKEIV